MAKVYSAPDSIKVPSYQWEKGREFNEQQTQAYFGQLRDFLQKRNPKGGPVVGKTIQFPVADGYAVYMVAGLSPVELVHIPIGDAWEFQYANRLTKKDVLAEIQRREKLDELFSKK